MPDSNKTTKPAEVVPAQPEISKGQPKTVGDEAVQAREPQFDVFKDEVPAQVAGVPDEPSSSVKVHEVSVTTDTVITDTSDPLAVQIPDAGRGSLDLPIHALANKTPEQIFAGGDSKADEK